MSARLAATVLGVLFAIAIGAVAEASSTISTTERTTDEVRFVNGSLIIRSNPDAVNRSILDNQTLPGMTHIECYMNWATLEPQPGRWAMDGFNEALALAKQHGLKMEILPCFVPPDWFKQSPAYTPLINAKTGQILPPPEEWMPNMSPWAPGTYRAHERFYAYLASHYKDQIDIIKYYTEVGLWVNRMGYWCGDPYARADFDDRICKKYGSMTALNSAWGTQFATAADITFPVDDQRSAQARRWIDFIAWLQDSQVRAMVTELRIIRKDFPETLVSIPLGYGSDDQSAGSDRTAAIRAAAAFGPVSIRSTHGSFNRGDYPMAYWFYKRMAPLCHDLNVGFGTEPPSGDLRYDEIRRQEFEDASAGANFIFSYWQNFHLTSAGMPPHIIDDYKRLLRPSERSLVDIGILFPTTQMQLDIIRFPTDQLAFCNSGRNYFDYDIVDENMIDWGYLSHYKVLLHTSGTIYRAESLQAIGEWLRAGGILLTTGLPQWSDIEGQGSVAHSWLTREGSSSSVPVSGVRRFDVGRGRIYAVDAPNERDYLPKVVAVLSSIAAARPAGSELRGFKAVDDGTYITDFPDGRLVFDRSTLDTNFVANGKKPYRRGGTVRPQLLRRS